MLDVGDTFVGSVLMASRPRRGLAVSLLATVFALTGAQAAAGKKESPDRGPVERLRVGNATAGKPGTDDGLKVRRPLAGKKAPVRTGPRATYGRKLRH